MKLNIKNETAKLKSVVLGQPGSMGKIPTLEESYDAKSYDTILKGIYPKEEVIIHEMTEFEKVLKKYDVQVFRPEIIEDYNQVFARDVAFVIEDKMIISNVIQDRADEQDAYRKIFEKVKWRNIINLPEPAHIEGGAACLHTRFAQGDAVDRFTGLHDANPRVVGIARADHHGGLAVPHVHRQQATVIGRRGRYNLDDLDRSQCGCLAHHPHGLAHRASLAAGTGGDCGHCRADGRPLAQQLPELRHLRLQLGDPLLSGIGICGC